MFPATFAYERPASLEEALHLLQKHGDEAKLLAGGHSLLPAMRLRLAQPAVLIDIGRLQDLAYIRTEGEEIAVGALTTHHAIESSGLLAGTCLGMAAGVLADVQVRNRGTIGGALAHADPAADYPACVLALGACMVVAAPQGRRRVPATDWFDGPFTSALRPGEILVEVRFPAQRSGQASTYRKFVRRATDYGMVGVAVWLEAADGTCSAARVALTCTADTAYRAGAVEAALAVRPLTAATIRAAAAHAVDDVNVAEDAYVPADYRAHLARVETERAIAEVAARLRV